MKKKKSLKKRAKKALLTATAATSLLVNNAYDNPLDIIDDASADGSLEETDEEKGKNDLKSSFRRIMGQIPLPIRAAILVPLWVIGWALMLIINPIIDYIIIPNINLITNWLMVLAIVVAIVILAGIFIFPTLPFSKLFTKKVFKLILILIIACAIGDKIASVYYEQYRKIKLLIKVASGAIISCIALIKIYRINKKIKFKVFTDKYQFSAEY